jgi:hypothetical protein
LKTNILAVVVCLLVLSSTGCGTIVGLSTTDWLKTSKLSEDPDNKVYIGARVDWIAIGQSFSASGDGGTIAPFVTPIVVADFVLSVVADTLILPVTLSLPSPREHPAERKNPGETLESPSSEKAAASEK